MSTSTPDAPSAAPLVYSVPGMSCGHCKSAIEGGVGAVAGVASVVVDLDTKLVTVAADPSLDAAIRQAIDDAGYDVA